MVCVMLVGDGFHDPLIGCLLYVDLGVCSEKKNGTYGVFFLIVCIA